MGFVNTIGSFFFSYRDKLPIPLALAMVKRARPRLLNWVLGLPLVISGELLRIWGLMHIGPTTRTRKVCADRLITSGPYACCRNPLYLANMLKVSGFMIITGDLGFGLVTALFYILEFSFMIPFEENFLAEKFPQQHQKYRQVVPAFLPGPKQKEFDAEPAFSLSEAVTSERRTISSTSLVLVILMICTFWRRDSK